jgi:hypothetical protein
VSAKNHYRRPLNKSELGMKANGQRFAAKWLSTDVEICRMCQREMKPGVAFVRGLTKEPYHPACRRLLSAAGPARPVKIKSIDSGETCAGCADFISSTEKFTRVSGVPWHKECFLRERRM